MRLVLPIKVSRRSWVDAGFRYRCCSAYLRISEGVKSHSKSCGADLLFLRGAASSNKAFQRTPSTPRLFENAFGIVSQEAAMHSAPLNLALGVRRVT